MKDNTNPLDFYKRLHESGHAIPEERLFELRAEGLIKEEDSVHVVTKRKVSNSNAPEGWPEWLSYEGVREIQDHEWKPKSVLQHTPEFVGWVNSFLYNAFIHIGYYEPFERYCQQAYTWGNGMENFSDILSRDAKRDYVLDEYDKSDRNTLFWANLHGYLKEGDESSGRRKYSAMHQHAVIFYLLDCGYSTVIGKGRQIGSTSAIGLWALKRIMLRPNYYIKFIAEDDKTGQEIFNDKIKYPFTELPARYKFTVKGESQKRFWLTSKTEKGGRGIPNSSIEVVPPSNTAINGGSPQVTLIDEIGNIPMLGEMLNEARPTLYWINPITGIFEMKRQVCMWGTGGKMDKGKGAYEREWYRFLSLWEDGQYQSGIVPIFFSWHCRLSQAEYEKEKSYYYGGNRAAELGIDLETSKTQFHQHYPSTFRDMFRSSTDTIVSQEIINEGLTRIRSRGPKEKAIYGFFEPIYDLNQPMDPNSDVPFKIIGSNWVPVDDDDVDRQATSIMWDRPQKGWFDRYYQGTDPIASESGVSYQSSTILDDYINAPVCLVNFRRKHDHKYSFLQTMLAGIYYDTTHEDGKKAGIPELVENNIGTNYMDYKETKGFRRSLVYNSQLPPRFRGGGSIMGIDNKTVRNQSIIDKMIEFIKSYHQNINIETYFLQLETFTRNVTATGKEVWGPKNKKINRDDSLFSLVYSYICRESFPDRFPYEVEKAITGYKLVYELVRQPDGSLCRKPRRVPQVKRKKVDNHAANAVRPEGD
jgi:hypothetical protein